MLFVLLLFFLFITHNIAFYDAIYTECVITKTTNPSHLTIHLLWAPLHGAGQHEAVEGERDTALVTLEAVLVHHHSYFYLLCLIHLENMIFTILTHSM